MGAGLFPGVPWSAVDGLDLLFKSSLEFGPLIPSFTPLLTVPHWLSDQLSVPYRLYGQSSFTDAALPSELKGFGIETTTSPWRRFTNFVWQLHESSLLIPRTSPFLSLSCYFVFTLDIFFVIATIIYRDLPLYCWFVFTIALEGWFSLKSRKQLGPWNLILQWILINIYNTALLYLLHLLFEHTVYRKIFAPFYFRSF